MTPFQKAKARDSHKGQSRKGKSSVTDYREKVKQLGAQAMGGRVTDYHALCGEDEPHSLVE